MMLAFTVDSEGIPSCKIGRRPELHRLTQAYEEPRIRAQIFISLPLSLSPFLFFFHKGTRRRQHAQGSLAQAAHTGQRGPELFVQWIVHMLPCMQSALAMACNLYICIYV